MSEPAGIESEPVPVLRITLFRIGQSDDGTEHFAMGIRSAPAIRQILRESRDDFVRMFAGAIDQHLTDTGDADARLLN